MPVFPYFYLLPVIPAGIMAVSDFRRRTIDMLWLIVFGITVISVSVYYNGMSAALSNAARNTGLLVYLLACGAVYWRVRYGRWLNPVNNTIGSGDVFFICFVGFMLELRVFLVLLLSSMVVSLVWWALRSLRAEERLTIPLVGITGIVLSLWLVKESLGL